MSVRVQASICNRRLASSLAEWSSAQGVQPRGVLT